MMSIFGVVIAFLILLSEVQSTSTEDDFYCPKPRGYFAHKTRCDLYYICYGGVFTLESCRKGQLFDDDYKRCLLAESTECGNRIAPSDEISDELTNASIGSNSSYGNWTTVSNDQVETSEHENIGQNGSWINETNEPHYTTGHQEWNTTTVANEDSEISVNETWNSTQSESFNSSTSRTESTTAYIEWNITSGQDENANKTSSPWHTTTHGGWNITSDQQDDWDNTTSEASSASNWSEGVGNSSSIEETTSQVSSSSNWSEVISNSSSTMEDTSRPENNTEGVTTTKRPSTTEEAVPEEPSEEEIECPEESGVFPHPSDPSMYIHCSAWFPHVKKCPGNLVFDPVLGVCAWPQ